VEAIMFDKKAALDRVSKILAEEAPPPGESWAIAEDHTTETASAWIFFYNTQQYLETGNVIHALGGNGPVFVNKTTGKVQFYGSAQPLEEIIANYEKSRT
jgi:Immunity protein 35